eukprot:4085978-Pleurochrysis_carterae.AAC.1
MSLLIRQGLCPAQAGGLKVQGSHLQICLQRYLTLGCCKALSRHTGGGDGHVIRKRAGRWHSACIDGKARPRSSARQNIA